MTLMTLTVGIMVSSLFWVMQDLYIINRRTPVLVGSPPLPLRCKSKDAALEHIASATHPQVAAQRVYYKCIT